MELVIAITVREALTVFAYSYMRKQARSRGYLPAPAVQL